MDVDEEQLSLVDRWTQAVGGGFQDAGATQSSGQGRRLNGGRFSDLELGGEERSPIVPPNVRTGISSR